MTQPVPIQATQGTSIEDLFVRLRQAVLEAPRTDLPQLLGSLVELEEGARLRLREPAEATVNTPSPDDRLLTIPEAAKILGLPEDYTYGLARQRSLPVVRPPGLTKGGRQRDGKYVRVRWTSLLEWMGQHEDRGYEAAASLIASPRARKKVLTSVGMKPIVKAA